MTTLGKSSTSEKRADNTTWVRDLKTGDEICAFRGWYHAFDVVAVALDTSANWDQCSIQSGPCEGVEYLSADGEPVAWIDEPPHSFETSQIYAALFPEMAMAAE